MRRLPLALLLLVAIAGCSGYGEPITRGEAPSRSASSGGASRYLAYEHSVQLDAEERNIAAVYEAGQAACRAASIDLCTVLESRINSGRHASASLKFRTKPSGIPKLLSALSKRAEITDQSKIAEDLAGPIEDAARKLAMLNDYRAKLEALRERAGNDADALIKVNRELAQVQSELEAFRSSGLLERHVGLHQMTVLFPKLLLALCVSLAIGGCVSVDPRALQEQARSDSATSIVGTFNNRACYRSRGVLAASDTLSFALGIHHIEPDSVTVSRPSASTLKFEFQNYDESKFAKIYDTAAGLIVKPNGQFDVPASVGCGGHHSPGFGCGTKTVTLFINASGDLAAIESGGGGPDRLHPDCPVRQAPRAIPPAEMTLRESVPVVSFDCDRFAALADIQSCPRRALRSSGCSIFAQCSNTFCDGDMLKSARIGRGAQSAFATCD